MVTKETIAKTYRILARDRIFHEAFRESESITQMFSPTYSGIRKMPLIADGGLAHNTSTLEASRGKVKSLHSLFPTGKSPYWSTSLPTDDNPCRWFPPPRLPRNYRLLLLRLDLRCSGESRAMCKLPELTGVNRKLDSPLFCPPLPPSVAATVLPPLRPAAVSRRCPRSLSVICLPACSLPARWDKSICCQLWPPQLNHHPHIGP
jgi:hypothetical protein